MNRAEQKAVMHAFVRFKMLAENSLGPSAKKAAMEGAGFCLTALGIDRFENFAAMVPDGKTIDAEAMQILLAPAGD